MLDDFSARNWKIELTFLTWKRNMSCCESISSSFWAPICLQLEQVERKHSVLPHTKFSLRLNVFYLYFLENRLKSFRHENLQLSRDFEASIRQYYSWDTSFCSGVNVSRWIFYESFWYSFFSSFCFQFGVFYTGSNSAKNSQCTKYLQNFSRSAFTVSCSHRIPNISIGFPSKAVWKSSFFNCIEKFFVILSMENDPEFPLGKQKLFHVLSFNLWLR